MADKTVTIRITAQDSFSGVINKYNQAMGTAEQTTRRANTANAQAAGSFDGLGRSIAGAAAAIGVMGVIQFGADMHALGTQVDVTAQNFESLSARIGGSEQVMADMRSATRGTLNDLELMQVANQILALGMADSSEQMAVMTQQAIQLGGAMGTSAIESVESLQRAIRNNSFEMLDQIGVNAGNVRARIRELTAAGVEMSTAFRQATLEGLAEGVERLGASADAAFRPTDVLLSRMENFQQQAARNIAQGIDGIALAVLNLDKVIVAADDAGVLSTLFSLTAGGGLASSTLADQARASLEAQGQMDITGRFGSSMQDRAAANAASWTNMGVPGMGDVAAMRGAQMAGGMNADYERMQEIASQVATTTADQTGDGGFFREDRAEWMRNVADEAGRIAEEWERMAETQPVDETKLANMQNMAEALDTAATNAERSAAALRDMSLAQMMGQGGGGRTGELGDMVLGGMDLPEDEMRALQDAMDIASGRQTELSQTVRDELVPVLQSIAENEGPDALADAVIAFEEAMTERTREGQDPAEMNLWLEGMLGGGGLGRSSGRGGEGEGGMAMDSEGLMAALEGSAGSMATMASDSTILATSFSESIMPGIESVHGLMPEVEAGFSGMAGKAEVAAGFITTAHELIGQLVGSVQNIRMNIVPTAPAWLIALASGSQAGGAFVAQVVQGNGGTVPGTTGR